MASENHQTTVRSSRPWHHRIGPGLITACVVIGPGSVLTSSKTGAKHGYELCWVVVVAVMFMLVYTSLGAKLGVATQESTGTLVARRAGRWLAVLVGLGVFFISASFQFGNNLGVHAAASSLGVRFDYTIVAFNALAIAFLFGARNFYRQMERLMMVMVGLMLVAFTLNLLFAGPSIAGFARGLIPRPADVDVAVLGLVGTTFVITAAYFQSYLVKQKGWTKDQLGDGMIDARIGAILMCLITLLIMCTAAAVLQGRLPEDALISDVAAQLRPLFGTWGQVLFAVGLFAAAFSSFIVNSLIGGFILSDGIGLGSRPQDIGPKLCATAVLLTGMVVALFVIKSGTKPVAAIVMAQAVTVIASPLMAGVLLWLTNSRPLLGDLKNSMGMNFLAALGFVLLLCMAWYTAAYKVLPAILGSQ